MSKRRPNLLEEWSGKFFLDWLWHVNLSGPMLADVWASGDPATISADYQIAKRQQAFEESGNPLAAIEAFLLVTQREQAPPWYVAAIRFLFDNWHSHYGRMSLDECFGLKPKQGQRSPIFKKELEQRRDGALCFEIFLLKSILPPTYSVQCAAALVADTYRVDGESVPMIWASTLKARYDAKWRRLFERDPMMQSIRAEWKAWPDERRHKHLATYYRGGEDIARGAFPPMRKCRKCSKPFKSTDDFRRCPRCRKASSDADF